MKNVAWILALLLVVGLPVGCGGKKEEPKGGAPEKAEVPEAPQVDTVAKGKAVMEASCVTCHDLDKVTSVKKDRHGWENQVLICTDQDPLDEEDQEALLDYLVEKHGE